MRSNLVTGGAGFLGSHLCERLLKDGQQVICIDNFYTGRRENVAHLHGKAFELVRHDVTEPFYAQVDCIYHLACPASPVHYQRNPVRTLQTAVTGTARVLDLARDCGCRVVIASTSEVYGDPHVHPQPESYWGNVNPFGLRACYDEGKRCAEALAFAYSDYYGIDVRIARIFNTYGPRMCEHDGRVVSNFVLQALRNEPITIYGSGDQTRSFCYVADMVEGLIRLQHCDRADGPINLGNPTELRIIELARLIKDVTGSRSAVEFHPLPADDPSRRKPDIRRAQEVLGWSPTIAPADGIRATVEYFEAALGSAPNGHQGRLLVAQAPS